jgi:glycosyltransferase involved in cell wall biosynthesis
VRIALVVPGGVDRGGEYRVIPALLWLIERLARRHDVQVVVPRQEAEPARWALLGATVHNVGASPGRVGAVRTLVRLHRERPLDLIHALWARGPGEVALAASLLCRRPLLVHVAGGELVWLPEVAFGARWPWRRALARFVLRRADRVSAASEPTLELAARAGVQAARRVRVPLGVDTTRWTPEPPRPRAAGDLPGLVHVGSLTPVKDHTTLLHAVAVLERDGCPVRLDLVGEDTSGGAVPRQIEALGLGHRVTVHGFLPQAEAWAVVRRANLMVVSSRHEAGPVAMLEAAAVGVPIVGTEVGHVREWAPEAAEAVPVGDAGSLAGAIAALVADDKHRLELARRGQERALREDADWTATRFEQLYREVVQEHDGRPRHP